MGIKIDDDQCNLCNGSKEPLCIKYCPGDLIHKKKNKSTVKLYNDRDCWDCMVCIKVCPREALQTRLPYQLASYKASLSPKIYRRKIVWESRDINGQKEVFELPIARSK